MLYSGQKKRMRHPILPGTRGKSLKQQAEFFLGPKTKVLEDKTKCFFKCDSFKGVQSIRCIYSTGSTSVL